MNIDIAEKRYGVFTTLEHAGERYVVPLIESEDSGKYEQIVGADGLEPWYGGCLGRDGGKYGLLGGSVKPGEGIDEAMRREFGAELAQLVSEVGGGVDGQFESLFSAAVFSGEPELIERFRVAQARFQEGELVFRALFQLYAFRCELSDEQFTYLAGLGLLTRLAGVESSELRPFVRAYFDQSE